MKTQIISEQEVTQITIVEVAEIAQRLDRDEYTNPFEGLNDWHRLRAIAFRRPELVEPYMHLLDLEAYDEA
ncbi:DUF2555 domain-containing protein [Microcoleus sp. FACHB-1515]|uniref:protein IsiD n=1 Tax=Cyanophyceae TaxID=3028117 RepID=UPI00168862F0|nr:DUF2555 domain-containing protein [Microcoleus sp. FACHB-1515]MBD2088975.1 DUF2555 domain-containing protein [Microcoleus sp. FACHB-1515]